MCKQNKKVSDLAIVFVPSLNGFACYARVNPIACIISLGDRQNLNLIGSVVLAKVKAPF